MTVVQERPPVHMEVQAEIPLDAIHTATHGRGLYQSFLELPVPVVLLTLWVLGVALIGGCALTLYYLFWVLLDTLAGL